MGTVYAACTARPPRRVHVFSDNALVGLLPIPRRARDGGIAISWGLPVGPGACILARALLMHACHLDSVDDSTARACAEELLGPCDGAWALHAEQLWGWLLRQEFVPVSGASRSRYRYGR